MTPAVNRSSAASEGCDPEPARDRYLCDPFPGLRLASPDGGVRRCVASKFDVAPPSARTVLQLLHEPRLLELSRELGVVVKSSANEEEQVGALAHKSRD